MIPQTRTDLFLAKITGEDVTLPVPQTRFELYLANIAGESYELPAPNSRATLYLAKILGQDVELPEPQTRSDLYLAAIAGMSVQLPEAPTTREEWYLARWAEDAGYVTITGNPVSFNAVAAKLKQLKIAFSPVQEGSGDPSPENERPIRGWTGVNVYDSNENLAFVDEDHFIVFNGRGSVSDGVVSSIGDAARIGVIFPVTPDTAYSLTFTRISGGQSYYYIYEYSAWPTSVSGNRIRIIKAETAISSNQKINQGFTTSAGAKYVGLVFYKSYSAANYSFDDICLRLGAGDYDVVDHAGQAIAVDFGETYYGGYINILTGDGKLDLKYKRYIGDPSERWRYSAWTKEDTYVFYSDNNLTDGAKPTTNYNCIKFCNKLPPTDYNSLRDNDTPQIAITGTGAIYPSARIPKSIVSAGTPEAFNAYLANNPLDIVYELAEPIPFHVDPQQISSLAGTNNMWTDADTLTVEYRKDGNVSDAEALGILLGGRYTPATGPEDVPDREALRIITGR